jgi:hypothetical protein
MKNNVLNKKPEPAATETVWAFDLGKGSIGDSPSPRWGEGGRRPDEVNTIPQFLHKASLPCRAIAQRRQVIPAEFAETKTAAGRRRMWCTRQAHGSRRPSPAVGGIFVAVSGKDFQAPCRSDMVAVRKDYAAPTALGRIELKIPIKFSTRFGE